MKRYAVGAGFESNDVKRGCKILIINGLHFKLAEQKQRVIIVDLEDESIVRMFPVYDFCVKTGVKVSKITFFLIQVNKICPALNRFSFQTLPLEKRADGSFEHNLNKVYQSIKKGFSGPFKPRKYKL
jgi:hypothetical protein